MSAATRYPLCWPAGWRRRPPAEVGRARFAGRTSNSIGFSSTRALSLAEACTRLQAELDRLGAREPILSTNVRLRLDGLPYSNQAEPDDRAAAVYFKLLGRSVCLACDRWDRVADNVAALAAHIGAMRGQDRWGVGSIEQAFAGYAALPPARTTPRAWREVLGFPPSWSPPAAPSSREYLEAACAAIDDAFRALARKHHPDAGGSHEAMAELSAARDAAKREIGQ